MSNCPGRSPCAALLFSRLEPLLPGPSGSCLGSLRGGTPLRGRGGGLLRGSLACLSHPGKHIKSGLHSCYLWSKLSWNDTLSELLWSPKNPLNTRTGLQQTLAVLQCSLLPSTFLVVCCGLRPTAWNRFWKGLRLGSMRLGSVLRPRSAYACRHLK